MSLGPSQSVSRSCRPCCSAGRQPPTAPRAGLHAAPPAAGARRTAKSLRVRPCGRCRRGIRIRADHIWPELSWEKDLNVDTFILERFMRRVASPGGPFAAQRVAVPADRRNYDMGCPHVAKSLRQPGDDEVDGGSTHRRRLRRVEIQPFDQLAAALHQGAEDLDL